MDMFYILNALWYKIYHYLRGRKSTREAHIKLCRRFVIYIYFHEGVKSAEMVRRLGLSRQWVTKIDLLG